MNGALLATEELAVGYGARTVLEDVALSVRAGELWAVLGPNGAGKSTLLKTCLGLLPPLRGKVTLLDKPLGSWPREALAREVAWVPQAVELEAGFSGLELVLMGRAPHQRGLGFASTAERRLASAAMAELGLLELADRPVEAMSGGERRLLLLARAFVQSPRLLMLDEPTAFLDLRHQVEVLARVKARVSAGLGAVAVLHDVNLAAAFADRVLLVRDGKPLAQGPAAELLTADRLGALYGLSMAETRTEAGQPLFGPRGDRLL